MKRIATFALLAILLTCGPSERQQATAQEPQRLAVVAYRQVGGGYDWVSVWIVRDQETGAEFLITRTPNSVHSLQIQTEVRQ